MDELRNKIANLRDQIKQLQRDTNQLNQRLEASEQIRATQESELNRKQQKIVQFEQELKILRGIKIKYVNLQKDWQQYNQQQQIKENPVFEDTSHDNIFNQRIEKSLGELKNTNIGQWNQVLNRLNDMKAEMTQLKKKMLEEQGPPRRLISRLRQQDIRVGLFVDVQNIFYGARQFNAKLDFDFLLKTILNHRRLIRALSYVVVTSDVDQSGFITMLQHRGFEVKSKNLRLRADGSAKANWDIEITIDMLSLADKFDVIALVSGDGDFVPLVNILKTLGPMVEIYSFPHNTSRDLMESADTYMAIDQSWLILNEYEPLFNQAH